MVAGRVRAGGIVSPHGGEDAGYLLVGAGQGQRAGDQDEAGQGRARERGVDAHTPASARTGKTRVNAGQTTSRAGAAAPAGSRGAGASGTARVPVWWQSCTQS